MNTGLPKFEVIFSIPPANDGKQLLHKGGKLATKAFVCN